MQMPADAQGAPASEPSQEAQSPGQASEIVANIHSELLQLSDMLGDKFPDDQKQLADIIQAYQSFADGLGQSPGQSQAPMTPGTTTPEAGVANVKQAY